MKEIVIRQFSNIRALLQPVSVERIPAASPATGKSYARKTICAAENGLEQPAKEDREVLQRRVYSGQYMAGAAAILHPALLSQAGSL